MHSLALKRQNSFQDLINRDITQAFALRFLILKLKDIKLT